MEQFTISLGRDIWHTYVKISRKIDGSTITMAVLYLKSMSA